MTESELINAADAPATIQSLVSDLRDLGLRPGSVVIVHTSMSALGWIAGGVQSIVLALLEAVGRNGTLVMPSHSTHLSTPRRWSNPPVPSNWFKILEEELPAFDRDLTPTTGMGKVVECFRCHPQSIRSEHPLLSFVANGHRADEVTTDHPLSPGLGDGSPLGHLYELNAEVLLLGVGHLSNTSLHLAEYRANWPGKSFYTEGAPIRIDGCRKWVTYQDLELDESDFGKIGDDFEQFGDLRRGLIGTGEASLFSQREIVDFAVSWIEENRAQTK